MNPDPKLAELTAKANRDLSELLAQAFQAGFAAGTKAEKQRVIDLINPPEPPPPPVMSILAHPDAEAAVLHHGRRQLSSMDVTRAVLSIAGPSGVDSAELVELAKTEYAFEMSADQARSNLKVLARRDEAFRVERGRYSSLRPPTFIGEQPNILPEDEPDEEDEKGVSE